MIACLEALFFCRNLRLSRDASSWTILELTGIPVSLNSDTNLRRSSWISFKILDLPGWIFFFLLLITWNAVGRGFCHLKKANDIFLSCHMQYGCCSDGLPSTSWLCSQWIFSLTANNLLSSAMASWEMGTAEQLLQDVEKHMEKVESPPWVNFMRL